MAPSFSGLGHRPLTAVTRVRIPLGSQLPGSLYRQGAGLFSLTADIFSPAAGNRAGDHESPLNPERDSVALVGDVPGSAHVHVRASFGVGLGFAEHFARHWGDFTEAGDEELEHI